MEIVVGSNSKLSLLLPTLTVDIINPLAEVKINLNDYILVPE